MAPELYDVAATVVDAIRVGAGVVVLAVIVLGLLVAVLEAPETNRGGGSR